MIPCSPSRRFDDVRGNAQKLANKQTFEKRYFQFQCYVNLSSQSKSTWQLLQTSTSDAPFGTPTCDEIGEQAATRIR